MIKVQVSNPELDFFEVKSFPNPFKNAFKLEINTSSEERVAIKVYDLLGRTVDSLEGTLADIAALEIGSNYPSGVYNVVISQDENVKTLRIVKR